MMADLTKVMKNMKTSVMTPEKSLLDLFHPK
jgi:hypothetical protein